MISIIKVNMTYGADTLGLGGFLDDHTADMVLGDGSGESLALGLAKDFNISVAHLAGGATSGFLNSSGNGVVLDIDPVPAETTYHSLLTSKAVTGIGKLKGVQVWVRGNAQGLGQL